jgi:nucleoside-diphosphate-sugar epimerase
MPLNPAANFNPAVFADLAAGREIALPNLGRETLHHVHADDVAQAFVKAMGNWSVAAGESFHVVSPGSVEKLESDMCRGRSGVRRFRKMTRE